MLLCCWLAAVGAGLLKSEEILEGVARLSLANDIEFEEQNFIALMNEAREVSKISFANGFFSFFSFTLHYTLTFNAHQ